MSDFFVYLEDEGIIESTEWAFENLSEDELNQLLEDHVDAYLAHRDKAFADRENDEWRKGCR
jgi:hypothetical protein